MVKSLLIIQKLDDRFWYSCNEIEQSYIQVHQYLSTFQNTQRLDYTEDKFPKVIESIEQFIKKNPDKEVYLMLLSHNINFNNFAEKLKNFKKSLKLLIPIFGNMTCEVDRWMNSDTVLKGWQCRFLVASEAAKKQTQQLLKSCNKAISVVPYPINDNYTKQLTSNRYPNSFIYAGRISTSKNVAQLIQVFIEASKINKEIFLDIYGDFDNIGYHFHKAGESFEELKDSFYALIKISNGRVRFKGWADPKDLKNILSKYEYFVSMSTYHDEDFGLAIVNAIACGCQPILSKWGGYYSFKESYFVSVKKTYDYLYKIDEKKLIDFFISPPKIRTKEISKAKYLPARIAKLLVKSINQDFPQYNGVSDIFKKYFYEFKANNGRPYKMIEYDKQIEELYLKVYDGYL